MKALNLYAARDIRFEETEKPVITGSDDVIVKVKVAGICGSDAHRYAQLGPYIEGMTWGHEFSGVVDEIGENVKNVKVGDRVTVCPALYCGECESCKKAEFARCDKLKVIGAKDPGGFAEYVKIPSENVLPIPDEVDFETASMVEPCSVAIHGLYKTNLQPGEDIAVIGCGTIGLFAIQWAKIFGAKEIIALDIDDKKLEIAKQLGATKTINSMGVEPCEVLEEITNGRRADVVVESAGSPITSAQAFSLAKKGGRVVFLGIPYGDVMVKRFYFEKIVRNELSVFGSWNAISSPFPGKEWIATIDCMKKGLIDTKPLVTHKAPMSKGFEMFEKVAERKEFIGKILFFPEEN